jgi:hypothetical protein
MSSSHSPDGLAVGFDDGHAVANAGLLLPATLAHRLGIEQVVDELVDLGDRPGHHRPGGKVLTLLHAMVAGADCIDDADVLRTAQTAQLLGHRVLAPSTLGTFLRSFTLGHIRQLDRVAETVLGRAWAAGAGPGQTPVTIDVDSTICEVHGHHKGGAAYGYTLQLGYHPLLATRADTDEVLHLRLRKGSANTARGAERFVNELAGRVRRAGASGQLTLRADSGFWSAKIMTACRRHRIRFSITVRQTRQVQAAIAAIGEDAWIEIDYPDGGIAQVAETRLAGERLVYAAPALSAHKPRCGLTGATTPSSPTGPAAPWSWTPSPPPRRLRARHPRPQRRRRAAPLPLRSLPGQRRLGRDRHPGPQPAGLGRHHRAGRQRASGRQDLRRRLLALPGPLTRSARRRRLHLPSGWPWAAQFLHALARLRALPAPG